MRTRSLASYCLILIAWIFSGNTAALSLNAAHYQVYEGSGIYQFERFIYLVPKENTLIINGRVATPIRFMPKVPAYRMRVWDGAFTELTAYNDLNVRNIAAACSALWITCTPSSVQLFNGDFDGDGQSDLAFMHAGRIHTLRDADGGYPSVYASLTPPTGSQIASIIDRNSDGRADIVLSGDHGYLVSAESGQFQAESIPLITNTSLTGAIAGNFRVNEQGAATYNIPIMTFAGTAGVAPQVSLNYNSQSGSGIAGIGWSISGLSSITRCRQTEAQDNQAQALTFGAGDRFCLDGQRLILTSGSTYGAAGTRYRTEIDSGVEVTANGGTTGNPAWFQVTRKDGSVSQYGNSGNSKQLAGSATLTWAINQFADSAGNPIKFQYLNDTHGFRINRIDYAFGSNRTAATSGTYIAFTYGDRPDPQISYVNATRLPQTRRLTRIESFNNGASLRSYNLQYSSMLPQHGVNNQYIAADRSFLEALYECVGNTCLKPTRFEWLARAGNSINWGSGTDFLFENTGFQVATSWKPLDFNGDGIMDLAAVVTGYRTSNGNMFRSWVYVYQGQVGGGYSRQTAYEAQSEGSPFKIEVFDYNADGRMDVALWDNSSWKILLAKPAANGGWQVGNGNASHDVDTGITRPQITFIDINSNGLADAIYSSETNTSFSIRRLSIDNSKPVSSPLRYMLGMPTIPTGLPPTQDFGGCSEFGAFCGFYSFGGAALNQSEAGMIPAADIDGDGQLDFLVLNAPLTGDIAYYAYTIDGNSVSTVSHPQKYSWEQAVHPHGGIPQLFGDINADGAPDWLVISGSPGNNRDWRYVIHGKHWGAASEPLLTAHKDAPPQLVDLNRDGFLDVIWHDAGAAAIKVRYWNASAENFGPETVLRSTDGNTNNQHIFMDLNGDGALEYIVSANGKLTIYNGYALGPDAIITRIDNGMGNQTDISYERMSNRSSHYVGMDKRIAYEETHQEYCIWDTQCFNYPIRSVNAAGYYTALNSDWDYDLADLYDGTGLTPTYIPKDPSGPIFEFTAPIQIVTQVASSAPTGVDVNAKSRITYRYHEAKIQAKGRGLLGFRAISTTDEQSGIRTTTRYRQDFPFIGSPLLTEVRTAGTAADPDGTLLKRSFNDYGYVQTNGTDNTKRYQVWSRNVMETTYDLNGAETSHVVTQTAQPDLWGNITSTTVSTFEAGNHASYLTQVATTNTYAGGIDGVRYGRLSQSSVIHRRAGEPNVTRASSFTYYTSGVAANLLESETIAAGSDGTPAVTTTYSYDAFGNKSRAVVSTTGQNSRQTDWTYSSDGRYLESTTNALGHITESIVMRNAYGSPTRIEGLNGYWSEIEYDSQGRETYRTDATGAWQRTTYSMSNLNGVTGAIYRITTEVAGGGTSTNYFDALGRTIARSVVGFDGLTNWTRTEYDSSGRVKRQSEPYRIGTAEYWTVNDYDVLGRVVTQTLPGTNNTSTVTYSGLTTTFTNSLGQQRIERRNAAGEVIEIEDALGGRINNSYNATGQLRRAAVTAGGKTIATEISYDSRGQKTRMFDPDKGTWFYEYNGFGELVNQYKVTSTGEFTGTLANLKTNNSQYQRTHMVYDRLGRMTQRSDYREGNVLEGTATWTYDTGLNGIGKLASESGGGLTRSYYYGAYSPFANRTDWQLHDYGGEETAFTATIYDGIGRPWRQIDPLHFNSGTENLYNEYGYLRAIRDLQTGDTLYTAQQADVRGNITHSLLLGGETVERVYDPATGRLQVIKSSTLTGNGDIQHLSYSWDTLGNMASRNDLKHNQQQSFCYDALNRLIKSHNNLTGSCSLTPSAQDQEYDGFGNITRKTGVGTYTYSTNMKLRPHAVANAGGTVFNYDHNGNVTSDGTGRTFTYATFDLPTRINKGVNRVEFSYGADRARWKRVDTDYLGTPTVTLYMGNVERIQMAGGITKYRRNIGGVAIFNYNTDKQLTERLTLFTDALGSVVATRNVLTGTQSAMAFNPWGERVLSTSVGSPLTSAQLAPYLQLLTVPTTRGFTGHEMVDSMGLIHMNGRIYDARIGRFLQADILVDGVTDTQGYNRYSYGQNNPLSGVDPSGHNFLKKIVGIAVAAVGTWICGPNCGAWGYALIGGAAGAANAAANGRNILQGFITGGISAAAFYGIGTAFSNCASCAGTFADSGLNPLAYAGKVVTHGLAGGIMSVMQGGKFGHGFAAAGVTQAFSGKIDQIEHGSRFSLGRITAASVIGGTASRISGGKFANGAMTGAFSRLFNDEAHYQNNVTAAQDFIDRAKRYIAEHLPNNIAERMSEALATNKEMIVGYIRDRLGVEISAEIAGGAGPGGAAGFSAAFDFQGRSAAYTYGAFGGYAGAGGGIFVGIQGFEGSAHAQGGWSGRLGGHILIGKGEVEFSRSSNGLSRSIRAQGGPGAGGGAYGFVSYSYQLNRSYY